MPRTKAFQPQKTLEKALKLFWKQGFHATSMQDLVDHLGINRASMYATYGSKRELFLKSLHLYMEQQLQQLEQQLSGQPDLQQALHALFDHILQSKSRTGCFAVNTQTELLPGDKEVDSLLAEHQEQMLAMFTKRIGRAKQEGQLPDDLDDRSVASALLSLHTALQVMSKQKSSHEHMQDSVDVFLELLA